MDLALGALLLTGGASRRMGTPKALLPVGDTTLAEQIAGLLRLVADPVVEAGPGFTTLPAIPDRLPRAGPLAALANAWSQLETLAARPAAALVVACDLPWLSQPLLAALADPAGRECGPSDAAVVPELDGHLQPLCARYPAAALDTAVALAGTGARSLHRLLDAIEFRVLPGEPFRQALADVDSAEDLARLMNPAAGRP